jgi:hypothetical protein
MKEIYDQATSAALAARVDKLRFDTKPLWGKMNASQMLSHLQEPMRIGLGDKKLKRTLIGFLFGRIAKKKLFSGKPFPRNLPTDPTFVRAGEHDFAIEKNRFLDLLDRYVAGGPDTVTKEPHPFFGKLTDTEWGTSLWKHIDHHLQQFGV